MKRVLILCTGNSCRSQMAEALWKTLGQGQWDAYSAGSVPTGHIHPLAIRAMQEKGISLVGYESKSAALFNNEPFDLVVTVCDNARETCPVYPNAQQIQHWPFEDPADATGTEEERMKTFRRVRDEIETKIRSYLGVENAVSG